MNDSELQRRSTTTWLICGLLLLATMVNYMDRQSLANVSQRITTEFDLSNAQYGTLEAWFSYAFAVGTLIFGFVADKVNVRWLYPLVLLAWSAMGFLTGYTSSYKELLICRTLLGLFEAGHWPCALRTTQLLLSPRDRTLGNSVLQSGASIGAIVTPLIMAAALTDDIGSWRPAFRYIGAAGGLWAILWFFATSNVQLQHVPVTLPGQLPAKRQSFLPVIFSRRFLVIMIVVISINMCWQLYRAWLVKFLQVGRGYEETYTLGFMSVYYIFTDVGCIASGLATAWLARRGLKVTTARILTFGCFSALCMASIAIPFLPKGNILLAVLLTQAMGSLGVFPCYYSFAQALSKEHQGKVAGISGSLAWFATAPMQTAFGQLVDRTKSYDYGLVAVACLPMIATLARVFLWGSEKEIDDHHVSETT